jgi:hypothetical protein
MIKKTYFLTVAMLVCSVLILAPLNAQATAVNNVTSVDFGLDIKYCGADDPEGDSPWLTAIFTGSNGSVNLSLDATNLVEEEYVASWYFNFNPNSNLDATSLTIAPDTNSPDYLLNKDIYDATMYTKGDTVFHAASDRIFDLVFDFTQCAAPGASSDKRFITGIILEYIIEYTDPSIDGPFAEDFFDVSDANGNSDKDPFYSAAHVLRIDRPLGSGWIAVSAAEPSGSDPVPEPCTMILLGSGLISMAGFIRKFKK